jgi:hypothetical protein
VNIGASIIFHRLQQGERDRRRRGVDQGASFPPKFHHVGQFVVPHLRRGIPTIANSSPSTICCASPLPFKHFGVMNVIAAAITAQGDYTKMKHFTIDTDNNITVHPSKKAARDTGAGVFLNEVQLADLDRPRQQEAGRNLEQPDGREAGDQVC